MEKSANFNFFLPSRDNDTDMADINQISDNFRIIDNSVMPKDTVIIELGKKADKEDIPKITVDSKLSTISANPVENKAVTTVINQKLNLSGGTMSGNIVMNGNDILNVKRMIFLTENGEWLNMGNHSITNLATPTADNHAANKAYVDKSTKDIPKLSNDVNEIKSIVTGEMPFGIIKDSYINKDGVITPYQGWNRTEPVNCEGLTMFTINVDDYEGNEYNAFYDADNQFITTFSSWKKNILVPENAVTFIMSAPASALAKFKISRSSILQYIPATLLDTTIEEEVAQIEITTLNGKAFNCSQFHVQLDIPTTTTATKISCNVRRINGIYQGINPENSMLKTTIESGKHNLIAFSYEQFGNVYYKSEYGGQISTLSHKWNSMYNSVPIYTAAGAATLLNEAGTSGIKLTGLFPVGTIVKVWGGKVK